MSKSPSVVMIGLGYIGLPTAALIAQNKTHVHGVDINPSVVETINQGKIHIVEPELDTAVAEAVKEGYLRAATTPVIIKYDLPINHTNAGYDNGFINCILSISCNNSYTGFCTLGFKCTGYII